MDVNFWGTLFIPPQRARAVSRLTPGFYEDGGTGMCGAGILELG